MSHVKKMRKTDEERVAQIEKLQQYVTETCERECRQQDMEWLEQIRREKHSQEQQETVAGNTVAASATTRDRF